VVTPVTLPGLVHLYPLSKYHERRSKLHTVASRSQSPMRFNMIQEKGLLTNTKLTKNLDFIVRERANSSPPIGEVTYLETVSCFDLIATGTSLV
jgi:hypothetical protein